MNPILKDPAAGVPPQLLPHMHLVSKYRYPITSNPSLETIVGYLLEAPKIVRDLQPMQWQFIETPNDGTLILTWQPLEYLGTSFASDGYIWADVEHVFKSEVRGYTLEMFLQRSGYRAQGEAMASHSRRRYRLLPGNPSLGLPNPDSSLWLTHYSKASARDHVPAASIPVMPHVHAQMQQRRMIQSQGQLPRKEFMLHDRSNWPTIHLPSGMARGAPPQIPVAAGHRRGTSIGQETTLEEEEDVSRGDLLDFMTPRDISRVRYEQHHEWMEEIIESPYPTLSIVPSDLGLGRKGQLEELTKDFFDAPTSAMREPTNGAPPRVGKLAAGKADDFAKRASEKLASMQAELENMRKRHARRMEALRRSTTLTAAEKRLRTVPNVTERRSLSNDMTEEAAGNQPPDAIDEIMEAVESDMGQKLRKTTSVTLVSKGGLEERVKISPVAVEPPVPTDTLPEKTEIVPVADLEAVSQEQPQPQPPAPAATEVAKTEEKETTASSSEQPTQDNTDVQPTPSVAEPDQAPEAEPQPQVESTQQNADVGLAQLDDLVVDVNMDGIDEPGENENQDGNEWVMIGDGEENGQNADELELPEIPPESQQNQDQNQNEPATTEESTTQPSAATTTAPAAPTTQPSNDTPLDTPDFDMGGDFDNVDVDTAGDALASYGNDDDELNLDTMEDSAFGDAFHPEEDDGIA